MSMVSYDAINMGGGTSYNVFVYPLNCSVYINGSWYSNPQVFSCVRTLTIDMVGGDDYALCTWGDKNSVSIPQLSKYNDIDYVGVVDHEYVSEFDRNPLTLSFTGSTCITITPVSSTVMPVYCGIMNTTKSYVVGTGDGNARLSVDNLSLYGGYSVTYVERNSNPAVRLRVFNVVPSDNDTTAIMKYNNKYEFAPLNDDTPIGVYSGYDGGQNITGWKDGEGPIWDGWFARWVTVYCIGGSAPYDDGFDWDNVVRYSTTYQPRLTAPDVNNPYYIQIEGGGYNPCILGNTEIIPRPSKWSVLPNCNGYAVARFNEIGNYGECRFLVGSGNAEVYIEIAQEEGLEISSTPSLGACMVWKQGDYLWDNTPGHLAIVEVINDDSIVVSMSGWRGKSAAWTETLYPGDGNWRSKWMGNDYTFRGFIKNPAVTFNGLYNSDTDGDYPDWMHYTDWDGVYQDNSRTAEELRRQLERTESGSPIVYRYEKEVVGTINDIHGMKLLSTPTWVESPFIEVKIGDYTFGSFTREGTPERILSEARVTYPNYMDSLKITKVNGAINQYVLSMSYQIQAGDDPNLIDKVLGSVSDSRKIILTYGDWNAPSFVYRNEEALITKVTSNVDFQQSRIRYVLYCTSASVSLKSRTYSFGARFHTKPSSVIRELLQNNTYGLKEIFYGMKDEIKAESLNLIPSDDKEVDIKPQSYVDILTYLNYLVACMASASSQDDMIKDSAYYLVMKDEVNGELDGPYFQIVKVNTQSASISSSSAYEVDIGFPDNSMVLNFQINDDNSWAILYKYAESVNQEQYVYKIDDYGRLYSERTPNIMMSNTYYEATEANKTWWTKMTQFPISATLTIKGLIRPSMLMDYVKVNAIFYGRRHASSGLYVITKQEDSVDRQGYKTTLQLTRISGDDDELYSLKRTEVITPKRVDRETPHTSPRGKNAKDPVQATNEYNTNPIEFNTSMPGVEQTPYDDSVDENNSTNDGRSKNGGGNIGGGFTWGKIYGANQSDLTPKYEARREHSSSNLNGKTKPK